MIAPLDLGLLKISPRGITIRDNCRGARSEIRWSHLSRANYALARVRIIIIRSNVPTANDAQLALMKQERFVA